MAYKRNPMRCERIASLARFVVTLEPNANLTHGVQFFERTLDDSANRRLVHPGEFSRDRRDSHSHGEHRRAASRCIRRAFGAACADELPFMATEELIVRAVRAGGDRQVAHERIRQHSIEAARALKNGADSATTCSTASPPIRRSACRSPTCSQRSTRTDSSGARRSRSTSFSTERRRRRCSPARTIARGGRARGGARMTIANLAPLPLPHLRRGKVREVYVVDDDRLLLVATDRVSAFDVVMAEPIPYKGAVLTQITAWWLRQLGRPRAHHMLSAEIDEIVDAVPALADHRDMLAGRSMLCRRTDVFPVECVVRGYISGSAWKEYSAIGTLAGESLAPGLRESERLDPPIFSPGDESRDGTRREHHDRANGGRSLARTSRRELERLSRLVYERGRDDRRRARHHHRRYEIRVRSRRRRARSR